MIQIYYGNGKGKTTAAVGAAVRAAGSGMRVLFVQFYKNGDSAEIRMLQKLGIHCRFADRPFALFEHITGQTKAELTSSYGRLIGWVAESAAEYDMIVLDEGLDTFEPMLLSCDTVMQMMEQNPQTEWILTGHTEIAPLFDRADYISCIQSVRHPYERGVAARSGIEF